MPLRSLPQQRAAAALALLLLVACDPLPDDRANPPTAELPEALVPTTPSAAAPSLEVEPSAVVSEAAPRSLPDGAPERIAARHILVSYDGALAAQPTQRRTPAEAKARAESLRAQLAAGADFAGLARASSDDSSASQGGDLGVFGAGAMTPTFEAAAFALAEGELSAVVESPFGFHVIRREPLDEVHLSQVHVQWAGLPGAKVSRDRAAAQAQIEAARAALLAGQPISAVAPAHSDGPNAARGGELGWFQRGQLQPSLEAAAFSLPPGGVSEVIETPVGFHLLVRDR